MVENADGLIERFKTDPAAWKETTKLWCGLAGDSTVLIGAVYEKDAITGFECLADAQEVDEILARRIIEAFKGQLTDAAQDETLARAFGAVAADFRPRGKAVFQFLAKALKEGNTAAQQLAAAAALSQTNLSDAAWVLVESYPNLRLDQALIRMGDLAVPAIVSLVEKGELAATKTLHAIGTPDAARALVPWLWHSNRDLENHAGWILGNLLQQTSVEEALRDVRLTERLKRGEGLGWIWYPFKPGADSDLPTIVGRIAYLIINRAVPTLQMVEAQQTLSIDPRLAIPLCLIEQAAEIDTLNLYDFKKDINVLVQRQKKIDILNLGDPKAEIDSLPQQQPESDSVEAEVEGLVDRILNQEKCALLWTNLFSSLDSGLQLDLLHRLVNNRLPDRNDWRNLFRRLEYDFKTSWHYWSVLVFATAVSLVAIGEMVNRIIRHPTVWMNGPIGLAATAVSVFLVLLFSQKEKTDAIVRGGLLGTLNFVTRMREFFHERLNWSGVEILNNALAAALVGAGALLLAAAAAAALVGGVVGAWLGTGTGAGVLAGTIAGALAGTGSWFSVSLVGWLEDYNDEDKVRFWPGILAVVVLVGIWVWAGAVTGAGAGAGTRIVAWAGALAGIGTATVAGIGFQDRFRGKEEFPVYILVLAFPLFCWGPITFCFATVGLLRFFSAWQVAVFWVASLGCCTGLWQYGQRRDRAARNPLHGIFDDVKRNA